MLSIVTQYYYTRVENSKIFGILLLESERFIDENNYINMFNYLPSLIITVLKQSNTIVIFIFYSKTSLETLKQKEEENYMIDCLYLYSTLTFLI